MQADEILQSKQQEEALKPPLLVTPDMGTLHKKIATTY